MTQSSLKKFQLELEESYKSLRERQKQYADNVPSTLLNQINDYALAIALTKQAVEQGISFEKLQTKLGGFNLQAESTLFIHNLSHVPTLPALALHGDAEEESLLPCPYRGLFAFREEDADLFFFL